MPVNILLIIEFAWNFKVSGMQRNTLPLPSFSPGRSSSKTNNKL